MMTTLPPTQQARPNSDLPVGVRVASDIDGLGRIFEDAAAAVLWHRAPNAAFQTWIDALDPELLPRMRVVLKPAEVREAAAAAFETSGTPQSDHLEALVEDIALLAEAVAALLEAPLVRLRLEPVTTNACRKFHVDAITARLVCSYRGSGTQYGTSVGGADPDVIHAAPAGSPIVLRGLKWPESPPSGLLHRSPPIEGTGETRLMLVLDPMFDMED